MQLSETGWCVSAHIQSFFIYLNIALVISNDSCFCDLTNSYSSFRQHFNCLWCSIPSFTTGAAAANIPARFTKSTYIQCVVTCNFLSAILIETALSSVKKACIACKSSFIPMNSLCTCQMAFLLIDFRS